MRAKDPTNQSRNRKRSIRRFKGRMNEAEKQIKTIIDDLQPIRVSEQSIVNNSSFFDYQLTPQERARLDNLIESIMNSQTLDDNDLSNWWWREEIERPNRAGALRELAEFLPLIALYTVLTGDRPIVDNVPPEQLLLSSEYQQSLNDLYVKNRSVFKGFSDRNANRIKQIITAGVDAGLSKTQIKKNITDQFKKVKGSDIERIVNTEVNKAFNDSKLHTSRLLSVMTGVKTAVIHISALLPTTRIGHANRHGNGYTVADQTRWWDSGTNRINCHCSTKTVLIDKKGNTIDVESQETVQIERRFF